MDAVLALLRIVLGGPNSRRWHVSQRRRQAGLWMLTGYSRFVGMMKLALPATAVAILGIIAAWPRLAPRDEQFKVAFASQAFCVPSMWTDLELVMPLLNF